MTTGLRLVDLDGAPLLEGLPDETLIAADGDARPLLEACFAAGAHMLLLRAENLPAAFFDLSSGVAAAVLQTLRTYGGRRLAVVLPADDASAPRPSRRFAEMEAEERWKGHFALCASEDEARRWLARP